jgi:hypothetical protein
MVGRPVVQALHGDDDGGGLALGPEPADVVAGNQAGELLDALVDLASFPLIEVLAAERGQDQSPRRRSPDRPGTGAGRWPAGGPGASPPSMTGTPATLIRAGHAQGSNEFGWCSGSPGAIQEGGPPR